LLRFGHQLPDNGGREILYRYLQPEDDVDAITAMLHEAYAPLAAQGMRFVASHQDSSTTRKRLGRGTTIVALDGETIVGVITLNDAAKTEGSTFYDRPDVAGFSQFAVRPSHQKFGIGSTLLSLVEDRARSLGVVELALDTSERATRLINLYQSRGYRFVEYVQWSATNYRSVILAKHLPEKSASERFEAHARDWGVSIDQTLSTETSLVGFGSRDGDPVVLKVIRKENSEEWRCGEILRAFDGAGIVTVLEHAPGAALLPRLEPGHNLTALCLEGNDDRATEIIAATIARMSNLDPQIPWVGSIERLEPDYARFRGGADGFIPVSYVDRAEALFVELCATQGIRRLLHGDLHHYNILFDENAGWVAIDPWGAMGEIEFEVGASLRNPVDAPWLLKDPAAIARRLRIYEMRLKCDVDRALKWAFATTVLGILWPVEPDVGQDFRGAFALAAQTMSRLLE
jgi:streptomycin 6-kinase